jgi:tyrosyl-DNA phosphodiesterase-1
MTGGNEKAAARTLSTGTSPGEVISLLDDDDDDDDGEVILLDTKPSPAQRDGGPLEAGPTVIKNAKPEEEPAIKSFNDNGTMDGCMKHPKHPIKIFATDRDRALRKRLRRTMSKTSEEYRHHWSNHHCWTFREMLGFDRFSGLRHERPTQNDPQHHPTIVSNAVGIDWIIIATYILDADFLVTELPELLHVPTVVVIYQYQDFCGSDRQARWVQTASAKGHSLTFLKRDPREQPGTATNPLEHTMEYGCHHTKMCLVGYSSGRLRVNIHTSNLRKEDLHDKCQGAFLQDFFPKNDDQLSGFETSAFEEALVTYLESYDFKSPLVWNRSSTEAGAETLVSHLQAYDFSTAVGVLIPSVPGYHTNIRIRNAAVADNSAGREKLFGYLGVQQAIRDHCPKDADRRGSGNIVCQFSSMGSLSKPYLHKLADAWNAAAPSTSSASQPVRKKRKLGGTEGGALSSKLAIVWPTVEEIETSVEGRYGGNSVPGRTKNLSKEFLRPLLHRWRSSGTKKREEEEENLGKGPHVPHIKTYYQVVGRGVGDDHTVRGGCFDASSGVPPRDDTDANDMFWFVLTSHNLSKAAWGEVQNRRDFTGGFVSTRETLVVQHWELGVFVAPSTLGVNAMGPPQPQTAPEARTPKAKPNRAVIPLPYAFRPDRYRASDRPWVVE